LEALGEDNEFSHEGGESEFFWFSIGKKALVKGFEDGVEGSGINS
jgi:FKBP-type peptidyl-prolyl cis-trans isomerase (trigger factor)